MSPHATPGPRFSIVTPVYNTPTDVLTEAIESVLAQTVDDWELILVDDHSPQDSVRAVLRSYAARDDRIRVIERAENGHIVRASNDGIDAANGEFIVLLDHDDLLTPDALARNAEVIDAHDDVDYVYSDEDKIDGDGRLFNRFTKPDWSPERLRSQNYCCHLSVLRAELVRRVGGFREGYDGSQDHDLILRVTEAARRIEHIPRVLYHWRVIEGSAAGDVDAKPYATEAGRRAVQDQMDRLGLPASTVSFLPGMYRVDRQLPPERRVSVVIPTRGSSSLIWGRRRVHVVEAVRSVLARTGHADIEIVVVYDDPATPSSVLDDLRELAGGRLVLVPYHEPFNYSRKTNFGVLASTGDRLVLLNDDVEVISEDWLASLLAPLEEESVGATGGKLRFSDTTIQHAGLSFLRSHYCHHYREAPGDDLGYFGDLVISREVSGVTGACLGLRRETYLEVGGLTEELPGSFNDVDLCYKIRATGHRIVYVAGCELYHFESQTRDPEPMKVEAKFIRQRWGMTDLDPFTPVFPDMPPTRAEFRSARVKRARSLLGLDS